MSLCNSHFILASEVFLLPRLFFIEVSVEEIEGMLFSSASVPLPHTPLFVSLCLIYSREPKPERKWQGKVGNGEFDFALRSHHFSGRK